MLDPEDVKEIKCPLHGDTMRLVELSIPTKEPSLPRNDGVLITGHFRGSCACNLYFNTGELWLKKEM